MPDKNQYFLSHSLHLILSRFSLAISGVFFWWIAARNYSVEEIGLGSVFISASSFLIFISSLGIAPTFVRFLPEDNERGKLIGTFLAFSLSLLVLFCGIFLIGIDFFLPKANILKTSFYPALFFIFVFSMYIFQTLDGIYISFSDTYLVLLKNVIQNFSRIFLLFLFIFLGGFGIFSSNCLAALVAVLISVTYFVRRFSIYKFWLKFKVDLSILKKLFPFSLVNFLNALSLSLPGMLFPLIILSLYSKREAGLFYIPWMIFSVYCSIITSINSIFLMKASYGEDVKELLKKVLIFSIPLSLIGFIIFVFWGDKILLIFKKDFSQNSYVVLKILFYSIFSFLINQVYITISNIKKEVLKVGIIAILIIIAIIVFSIFFLPKMGSEGIALAWLFSNLLGTVYILIIFLLKFRDRLKIESI